MNDSLWDVVVIGGGPAGLGSAIAAEDAGAKRILLVERDNRLGGILPQCIHHGFGLHRYQEELTGPEYAERDLQRLKQSSVTCLSETFVTDLVRENGFVRINLVHTGKMESIKAHAVVLAMGCRERTAGGISLPGNRPAGIYTAGSAQRLMNLQNIMVGKEVVIAGSGDIGLIMARRMTLEGAKVHAVTEIMPYAGGLARNIHQCLVDFAIPLYLSTQVINVYGRKRIEGVRIAPIGPDGCSIIEQGVDIACDTLLLSVGLIPENELSRKAGLVLDPRTQGPLVDQNCMTSIAGIFACGNVLHVHDVADFVSEEAIIAGTSAALYSGTENETGPRSTIHAGAGLRYAIPQVVSASGKTLVSLRVQKPIENCQISMYQGGSRIFKKKHIRLLPSEMVRMSVDLQHGQPVEVFCE